MQLGCCRNGNCIGEKKGKQRNLQIQFVDLKFFQLKKKKKKSCETVRLNLSVYNVDAWTETVSIKNSSPIYLLTVQHWICPIAK